MQQDSHTCADLDEAGDAEVAALGVVLQVQCKRVYLCD